MRGRARRSSLSNFDDRANALGFGINSHFLSHAQCFFDQSLNNFRFGDGLDYFTANKDLTLAVTRCNTKVGLEGKAEISRKDFGLVWNAVLEGGGVLVGDSVKLEFDVEATKA